MAKRRKAGTKAAAKKPANKSSKTRAKKAAAGHKRTRQPPKSKTAPSFFDHFLSIFAAPERPRKT
jgi:hypothetical protein